MYRIQVVSGPALAPTANLTSGSAVCASMSSTAGVLVGSLVLSSSCVPPDTLVASVDGASQITLTNPAFSSATGATLSISNEPVTLAQAKAHARIEYSYEDPIVAGLIISARRLVETLAGQRMIATTLNYFGDNWPWLGGYFNRVMRAQAVMGPMPYWLPNSNTGVLNLMEAPLLAVNYVKYKDFNSVWQTIAPSLYIVDTITPGSDLVGPSRIQPAYGQTWPIPQPTLDSINIQFTAGYGQDYSSVPANIKTAILMLVSDWYENREATGTVSDRQRDAVLGLIGASDHGAYT